MPSSDIGTIVRDRLFITSGYRIAGVSIGRIEVPSLLWPNSRGKSRDNEINGGANCMEHSGFSLYKQGSPLPKVSETAEAARSSAAWLDLRALCMYACVSERTLREWIHRPSDALPAYRIEKKIFVKRSEFDDWICRHVIRPVGKVDIEGIVSEVMREVAGTR